MSVAIETGDGQPELVIVSALPDGCNEPAGHGLTRDGDTFTVEITNLVKLGLPCTEQIRVVETEMLIDGGVEACKVYEVIVNGEAHRVQAVDPSITCDTTGPGGALKKGLSDLIDELRAAGLTVERAGIISQRFFSVAARILKVNEETIQVFEYTDETAAEKEAARVSPDGHNFSDEKGRTFMDVAWIDTPHFLRDGEIIFLYVGNDATVLDVLYRALGPQFAGGRSEPVGPPAPGDSMIEVPAPIDSVEVVSTNYPRLIPPDYFLNISSGLPIGCVKFGGYEVEIQGRTIIVTVSNIQPSDRDVTCTMQSGIVETRIELGRDFEPGVEYTVVVNGAAAATFRTPGKTGIDRPFEVKLHETATIESQDLSIEFIEVLEDSRCAANVTCIGAGRARVLIGISLGGEELGQHELTLEGGQGDLAVARVGGYLVGFVALNPYPGTSD